MNKPKKVTLKKAVAIGLALTPTVIATEALAGTCSQTSNHCSTHNQCSGSQNYCEAPEMSDYLAMSFVAMAGGMLYHFRRKTLEQVPALQTAGGKANRKRNT